jgi:hypothetical protein
MRWCMDLSSTQYGLYPVPHIRRVWIVACCAGLHQGLRTPSRVGGCHGVQDVSAFEYPTVPTDTALASQTSHFRRHRARASAEQHTADVFTLKLQLPLYSPDSSAKHPEKKGLEREPVSLKPKYLHAIVHS